MADAQKADKPRRLPEGMGKRLGTMLWFTIALGFTGFGNTTELALMPFFAWIAVFVAMAMVALWGDRTRPRVNGFWILLGILWFALAVLPIRPYLGFVATLPVALSWLHDSPASPSVMLTWGLWATVWQDFAVWDAAGADTAFYVVLAMVLVIGAAQSERERLARRQYAPTGTLWMASRLAAILTWALVVVAGREALQVVSIFTYLGFDLTGTAGKVTMLMLILVSLLAAALLFRVRPHKAVDPYAQPVDAKGRRVARGIDFEDKAPKPKRVAAPKPKADAGARPSPKAPVIDKAKPKPAPRSSKGPLKPGEIDFD